MRQISFEEFKQMLARGDWNQSQFHEVMDEFKHHRTTWDVQKQVYRDVVIPRVLGWASKVSELEGIEVTYSEYFGYDDHDPASLTTTTDGIGDVWVLKGASIIDENGSEMDINELAPKLPCAFSDVDYSKLIIEQVTDIDVDENSEVATYKLKVDNAPSLLFTGQCLASVASSDNQAAGLDYSGQRGRCRSYGLYKTQGGKYICRRIDCTARDDERDCYSAKVCDTLDQVKDFFGYDWLAKDLYEEAGIDDSVAVA